MELVADKSKTDVDVIDERVPVPIRRLIDLAKAVSTIESAERRKEVGELHARLGWERRTTEEQKKNDAELQRAIKRVDDLRAPYTLTIDTLTQWEHFIKDKMQAFDRAALQKAREQQARVNAKTDEKNEQIEEKSADLGVKPVLKAPPIVMTPPKTVKTDDGVSSSRKVVFVFRIDGVGQDEDLTKLLGNDPRLAKIDDSLFLLNVGEIKKQVKSPALHGYLRQQGILIEEEFDYTSRG